MIEKLEFTYKQKEKFYNPPTQRKSIVTILIYFFPDIFKPVLHFLFYIFIIMAFPALKAGNITKCV